MSVVRDLILVADDELRYPSSGELRCMADFLSGGAQRIRIAKILTENERKIQCLRDFSWYLRLVTYGVLAGSTELIQKIGLEGAREMYNSLGVPMPGMVESMRCLKDASLALLSNDDAAVAAPYFDFLIQGMSTPT